MSAFDLQRRLVERLTARRSEIAEAVLDVRYHGPVSFPNGMSTVGAATTEDIAMVVLERNAEARALEEALEIVAEEYKRMTSPAKDPGTEAGDETETEADKEGLY
jgi:hypothetical protein